MMTKILKTAKSQILFYELALCEYNHDAKLIIFTLINLPELVYTIYLIEENHLFLIIE